MAILLIKNVNREINTEYYNLPMILMDKLANYYNERIVLTIDDDYRLCIYINNIDRLYRKKYLSNLEGRGYTYREACIDYIKNLMDSKFNIRYKINLYATNPLRTIIRKSNFNKYY